MMHFVADLTARPLQGELLYVASEHSLNFLAADPSDVDLRAGMMGTTSLAIGTLQIEVGVESGALLFVWGYHPRESWLVTSVPAPTSVHRGVVRVDDRESLKAGVSKGLALQGQWPTHFDPASGWVRVGRPKVELLVGFASGTIAGLIADRLTTLWLRPSGLTKDTPDDGHSGRP